MQASGFAPPVKAAAWALEAAVRRAREPKLHRRLLFAGRCGLGGWPWLMRKAAASALLRLCGAPVLPAVASLGDSGTPHLAS